MKTISFMLLVGFFLLGACNQEGVEPTAPTPTVDTVDTSIDTSIIITDTIDTETVSWTDITQPTYKYWDIVSQYCDECPIEDLMTGYSNGNFGFGDFLSDPERPMMNHHKNEIEEGSGCQGDTDFLYIWSVKHTGTNSLQVFPEIQGPVYEYNKPSVDTLVLTMLKKPSEAFLNSFPHLGTKVVLVRYKP